MDRMHKSMLIYVSYIVTAFQFHALPPLPVL